MNYFSISDLFELLRILIGLRLFVTRLQRNKKRMKDIKCRFTFVIFQITQDCSQYNNILYINN